MIELTLEQRQAVAQQGETPPRAVDPDTRTTYVLISEKIYARVKRYWTKKRATNSFVICIPMRWKSSDERGGMILRWTSTMTLIPANGQECPTW